jgi:hypothetical protein
VMEAKMKAKDTAVALHRHTKEQRKVLRKLSRSAARISHPARDPASALLLHIHRMHHNSQSRLVRRQIKSTMPQGDDGSVGSPDSHVNSTGDVDAESFLERMQGLMTGLEDEVNQTDASAIEEMARLIHTYEDNVNKVLAAYETLQASIDAQTASIEVTTEQMNAQAATIGGLATAANITAMQGQVEALQQSMHTQAGAISELATKEDIAGLQQSIQQLQGQVAAQPAATGAPGTTEMENRLDAKLQQTTDQILRAIQNTVVTPITNLRTVIGAQGEQITEMRNDLCTRFEAIRTRIATDRADIMGMRENLVALVGAVHRIETHHQSNEDSAGIQKLLDILCEHAEAAAEEHTASMAEMSAQIAELIGGLGAAGIPHEGSVNILEQITECEKVRILWLRDMCFRNSTNCLRTLCCRRKELQLLQQRRIW